MSARIRSSQLAHAASKIPASLVMLTVLGGCASAPGNGVGQYQDERTAVTVTVAATPLVFARDFPLLAANSRDYLSVNAIEVNRMGEHRYFLFGYVWSTIDRRAVMAQPQPPVQSFKLVADARPIELEMAPDAFGLAALERMPWPAPTADAIAVLYPCDRETLVFLAAAEHIVISPRPGAGDDPTPYELWPAEPLQSSGQDALRELLRRTSR